MLSHAVLRAADGRHAWQILVEGIDSPPEDAPPSESLGEALLAEVRGRLAGFGEVTSSAAYADLSIPAPGPGFGRPEGVESFSEDLPGWEAYAKDSGAPEAGQPLPDDLLAEIVPGGADGAFGPGLERTVKAFQEANGLAADGIVGPGTLKAIDARLGARPAR
jgi:peptidoglycan hydrolase-like protein with peptidoglycan-binding domain